MPKTHAPTASLFPLIFFIFNMEILFSFEYGYRRIREIIVQFKGSFVLELQQRAIEFNAIIAKHQNIR